MKVKVDGTLCTGHGRCWTVAPEVYDADDEGFNSDRDSVIEVPEGREKEASIGVASCPEGALQVIEE
jgi:ferredoxin